MNFARNSNDFMIGLTNQDAWYLMVGENLSHTGNEFVLSVHFPGDELRLISGCAGCHRVGSRLACNTQMSMLNQGRIEKRRSYRHCERGGVENCGD